MTPSRVWAALDDPRDPIRHDRAGASAEPLILARHRKWIDKNPEWKPYYCEHAQYVGYQRALAFMCPRCPEYNENADFSHPRPDWGDEELLDGFHKVDRDA